MFRLMHHARAAKGPYRKSRLIRKESRNVMVVSASCWDSLQTVSPVSGHTLLEDYSKASRRSVLATLIQHVDMTSAVKYPGGARTGRAVAPLYIGPDAVDAGVIVGGAMELCGGIPR